ncbi:MAG: hypothetical protein M0Z57_01800 [Deltaproteobacteria bacterium]|jgi:hypothetical protein|nr:hypothetical protein [Deltaproteobacteria bacterium]
MKLEYAGHKIDCNDIMGIRVFKGREEIIFLEITFYEYDSLGDAIQIYIRESYNDGAVMSDILIFDNGDTLFNIDPEYETNGSSIEVAEILDKYNIENNKEYGLLLKISDINDGIEIFKQALRELYAFNLN